LDEQSGKFTFIYGKTNNFECVAADSVIDIPDIIHGKLNFEYMTAESMFDVPNTICEVAVTKKGMLIMWRNSICWTTDIIFWITNSV
jgi:hypothetical protein